MYLENMYLTKLNKIMGDDYVVHQKIRKIFPGDQRVLFQRMDDGICVLSENASKNGISSSINLSSYVEGEKHSFIIRLNPTKRDIKTRKRTPLASEHIKGWIRDKLQDCGIETRFQYIPEGIRRSIKKGRSIHLASVLCFGTCVIKDAVKFREALASGIGPAKGFGFGMVNIFSV